MGYGDAGLGDEDEQAGRRGFDVLDPVVDEEGLAFTEQLPAQCFNSGSPRTRPHR